MLTLTAPLWPKLPAWVAAVAMLATLACVRVMSRSDPGEDQSARTPDDSTPPGAWRWRTDSLAIGLVFVLSLALRVGGLQDTPAALAPDEGVDGNTILDILGGARLPLVDEGREQGEEARFQGEPLGYMFLGARVAGALGADIWSMRLPIAFAGSLGAPAVYAFTRLFCGRAPAAIAGLWFAFEPWNVYLSRNINCLGEIPALVAIVLLLGALAIARRSGVLAVAAGVACGLMLHTHLLAILAALAVVAAICVLASGREGPSWARCMWLLACGSAGFLLVAAPLAFNAADIGVRLGVLQMPWEDRSGAGIATLGTSIRNMLDRYLEYKPARGLWTLRTAWTIPWLLAGLYYAVARGLASDRRLLAIVLLWCAGWVPPLVVQSDPTDVRRFLLLQVPSAILGACAIAQLQRTGLAFAGRVGTTILAGSIAANALHAVIGPMRDAFGLDSQLEQERVLRYAGTLEREHRVTVPLFMISCPSLELGESVTPELRLLMRLNRVRAVSPGMRWRPADSARSDVWLVPDQMPVFHPDFEFLSRGSEWFQKARDTEAAHRWIYLPRGMAERPAGLQRISYRDALPGSPIADERPVSTLENRLPPAAARVSWHGSILCEETGFHSFAYRGATTGAVELDGRANPVRTGPFEFETLLHKGYHQLRLDWVRPPDARTAARLFEWRPPGRPRFERMDNGPAVPMVLTSPYLAAPPTATRISTATLQLAWSTLQPAARAAAWHVRARNGLAVCLNGDPFGTFHRTATGDPMERAPRNDSVPADQEFVAEGNRGVVHRSFVWLPDGSFVVSNPVSRRIVHMSPTGATLSEFGGTDHFIPGPLAYDPRSGRLFAGDPAGEQVCVFDLRQGKLLASWAAYSPTAMAMLPDGDVALYSHRYARISIRDAAGVLKREWMSPTLSAFTDIAVDERKGWLLVLMPEEGQIARYTFEGELAGPMATIPQRHSKTRPRLPDLWQGLCASADGLVLVCGRFEIRGMRWSAYP